LGGALGSQIASGTATPATSTDSNAFFASFAIFALGLSAGTYWLELHGGSSLTDTSGFLISWAAVDDNATPAARMSSAPTLPGSPISESGFRQLAFQLEGTSAAPEPATGSSVSLVLLIALIVSPSCRGKIREALHSISEFI